MRDPSEHKEEEIHVLRHEPMEEEGAYAEDHKEDYFEDEILTLHHKQLEAK